MTIEEYAAAFCDLDTPEDFETWGESLGPTREVLAGLRDLSPPSVARDYHQAVVTGTEDVLDFIESQDPDDAFNRLALFSHSVRDPNALIQYARFGEALDALPSQTRSMLEDCLGG